MISVITSKADQEWQSSNAKPFCEKSYKPLRMFCQSLHLFAAIVYQVAAFAVQFFNAEAASKFQTKSLYSFIQFNRSVQYLVYGEHLIDFSVNLGMQNLEKRGETIQWLKDRFGMTDEGINWQPQVGQIIDASRLKSDMNEGTCNGVSTHFIRSYLKAIEAGYSHIDAIKKIAPLYAHGAPDSAYLTQMFYKAINFEHVKKIIDDEEQKYEQALKETSPVHSIANLEAFLESAKEHGIDQAYELLKVQKKYPIGDAYANKLHQIALDISLRASNMMGLRVTSTPFKLSGEQVALEDLEALPNGIYQVHILSARKGEGHGISYIKSETGQDVIFDPNLGTLTMDRQMAAKILQSRIDFVVFGSKLDALLFYSCAID